MTTGGAAAATCRASLKHVYEWPSSVDAEWLAVGLVRSVNEWLTWSTIADARLLTVSCVVVVVVTLSRPQRRHRPLVSRSARARQNRKQNNSVLAQARFPSNATRATYATHARKYVRKYVTNAVNARKLRNKRS